MYKRFIDTAKTKGVNVEARTVEVIITNETEDRDGDIVMLDGWNFESYLKNPVIFWGHETWTVPIASCTSLTVKDGNLVAIAQFPAVGADHAADIVFQAISDGRVRSTSVGFKPKAHERLDGGGLRFTEQELLEFSFVGVPANPDAVISNQAAVTWAKSITDKKRASKEERHKSEIILDLTKDEGDEPMIQIDSFVKCKGKDGIVEQVVREGKVELGGETFTPKEDDPAAIIRVLQATEGGMFKTDQQIVGMFSEISMMDPVDIVDAPVEDVDEDDDKDLDDKDVEEDDIGDKEPDDKEPDAKGALCDVEKSTDFERLFGQFNLPGVTVTLDPHVHKGIMYALAVAGEPMKVVGVDKNGLLKLHNESFGEALAHPMAVNVLKTKSKKKLKFSHGEAAQKSDGPKRVKLTDDQAASSVKKALDAAFKD